MVSWSGWNSANCWALAKLTAPARKDWGRKNKNSVLPKTTISAESSSSHANARPIPRRLLFFLVDYHAKGKNSSLRTLGEIFGVVPRHIWSGGGEGKGNRDRQKRKIDVAGQRRERRNKKLQRHEEKGINQQVYQPRPAILSPSGILCTLIPTMASPRPSLTSARTLASLW